MARQNATNFTGGLQFPYATAATDLFKKEDVQVLAQAVDQHDHSTGKGVVVSIPSGAITSAMIADGTITSADIADGTIATADLAAHAISQTGVAQGVTANPTTTSGTNVDLPDMSVTLSGVNAGSDLLAWLVSAYVNTVSGAFVFQSLNLDGGADIANMGAAWMAAANAVATAAGCYRWSAVSAGSHTVKGRWSVNAGTGTAQGIARVLLVMELRR